jgi:23S rRNA-/tRNA-specific pseudouridylate synthase
MVAPPTGRPARTRFEVRERLHEATLLELVLETGRKHQIRVHAAHAGHPLITDRVHGALRDPTCYEDADPADFEAQLAALPIQRHALHAFHLRFEHPVTDVLLEVEAPLPSDLVLALERLRAGR